MIHLDLKPANVLLGPNDVPWVTDFGLSASANLNSMSNSSMGGRGTLVYKAPERFEYNPEDSARGRHLRLFLPAADTYAFAILAWVVVTGEQPYQDLASADTMLPAMLAQGKRPELPSGDWRDSTNAGLAKLIEACWVQEPDGRPQFGGDQGVVTQLNEQEARLLKRVHCPHPTHSTDLPALAAHPFSQSRSLGPRFSRDGAEARVGGRE